METFVPTAIGAGGPPGHQASGNPGREGRGFLRMETWVRRISGNTHSNGLGSHLHLIVRIHEAAGCLVLLTRRGYPPLR